MPIDYVYPEGCQANLSRVESTVITSTSTLPSDQYLQLNGSLVGNIITTVKAAGNNITDDLRVSWHEQGDDPTLSRGLVSVDYDAASQLVSIYWGNTLNASLSIETDNEIGIARVQGTYYLVVEGLNSLIIADNQNAPSVNVAILSQGIVRSLKTGFTETHDFESLRDTLGITVSVNLSESWNVVATMTCEQEVRDMLPIDCPVSTCSEVGSCLQYAVYDDVTVAGMNCAASFPICQYTIGYFTDSDTGKIHLLVVDGSRGYISGEVKQGIIDSFFDGYKLSYGLQFEIVTDSVSKNALLESRNGTPSVDMVVLDINDPTDKKIELYRSLNSTDSLVFSSSLAEPSGMDIGSLLDCVPSITGTRNKIDNSDSCVNTIINVCTTGCSGWIYHPSVLGDTWKYTQRIQNTADIVFNGNKTDSVPLSAYMKVSVNTNAHTLEVTKGTVTTDVGVSPQVGMKLTICKIGNVISLWLEDKVVYRTVDTGIPVSMYIYTNIGNSVSSGLVEPKVDGKTLMDWEGDESNEELIGCGLVDADITDTFIVKNLNPECDTGKMYYREVTTVLSNSGTKRVFTLPTDVYRGYVDIYLENKGIDTTVLSIYMSSTIAPFAKDAIASNVVLGKGLTYVRMSQPLVQGESIHISTTRDNLSMLLQTVEETG